MVQEVMCRYSHPEKITTVQIWLQIGYAIAKSMLNFMVQSCKTMHSEIITQIWKCSLFTSFEYNIYNRIERITCPSLSAIWNPDFAKFWSKNSLFGPLIPAKKKYHPSGSEKNITCGFTDTNQNWAWKYFGFQKNWLKIKYL